MTSTASQHAVTAKPPPDYFARILADAAALWDKLEADPVLAGPWRQLFSQVQSPRHVLSELLQNADDAGATTARVTISGGVFAFEHDGTDFTADQFQSLCRFGFSNKRTLHTIGFRGIGFKATFSLGGSVEVHTPTLAVRFDKKRFTQPTWVRDGEAGLGTSIRVRIDDEHRERELRKNLQEWVNSPASLLFFTNIRRLEIDGVGIERRAIGPGPVPGSTWVELTGAKSHQILVAKSEEEEFPSDAMEEIRRERFADDVTLPPCRVELVWGLPGEQRLFVVLPTGVKPHLPFSCNAPFVQDPARMAIKDPSVSPTNRWLLQRLGTLAAEVMQGWLGNDKLSLGDRAQAYYMLPAPPVEGDNVAASTTSAVCAAFSDAVVDDAVLLNSDGIVAPPRSCFAPPVGLYDVWEPAPLLESFAPEGQTLLARNVNEHQRGRLVQWEWLEQTPASRIVELLEGDGQPPRPTSNAALVALWRFVEKNVRYDYGGHRRRRLAMVPVLNEDDLYRADSVVRLGTTRRNLRSDDWEFLLNHLRVADDEWLQHLVVDKDRPPTGRGDSADLEACRLLLKELGLAEPTPISDVVEHTAQSLFTGESVSREDCVRFAHILAALDVDAPPATQYVTRDNCRRSMSDGIMLDDGELDVLVPEEWANKSLLHPDYADMHGVCDAAQWRTWSIGERSGLWAFAVLVEQKGRIWSRLEVEQFVRGRGCPPPSRYRYSRPNFSRTDFDFDEDLFKHWSQRAKAEPGIWGRVLSRLLKGPASEWSSSLNATVSESGSSYSYQLPCDPIPAQWVYRLRSLPCLSDTFGHPHAPAELLIRTPETEPLLGVEPFVAADFDREETKPLLLLLGARDTPAGAGSILDRIRALAAIPAPPLSELAKWYDALDRVLARRRPDDLTAIQEAFAGERLIFSAQNEWVSVGEVFQRLSDDDPPDLPVLHGEFATLAMWAVMGVAEHPSPDLLIEYLKGWESGRKLDGAELKRLRSILPQMPSRIWQECEHWLSLDGSWMPTTFFDLALFDDASIRVRELFPAVKQRTADCRSLSSDARHLPTLAKLRDLGQSLDFRLSRKQADLPPVVPKAWMRVLGSAFARIELPDGPQQAAIRESGRRLATTQWQPFRVLGVTPYLDGTPAGQDHEPEVLWDDHTLFVRQATVAKILDPVVAEVGRYFPGEAFQKAIRSCVERDEAFVAEYLAGQFALADKVIEPPPDAHEPVDEDGTDAPADDAPSGDGEQPTADAPPEKAPPDAPAPTAEEPTADPTEPEPPPEPEGAPEPSRQQRDRKPRDVDENPPLIAKFAVSRGFRWDGARDAYVHADGTQMVKAEGLFPWEHRHGERMLCRYWPSEQCLTKGGIELGADLWELIRKSPDTTALVLLGEDSRPLSLRGSEIVKMIQGGAVTLFPAKYRIRKEGTSQ